MSRFLVTVSNELEIIFAHCWMISSGARGVMVIVVGNGHGDTSSSPGQDWLHFT